MADSIGKLAVVTSVENAALKSGFRDAINEAMKFQKAMDKAGTFDVGRDNFRKAGHGLRAMHDQARSLGSTLRQNLVSGIISGGTAAAAMIGGELLGALGGSVGDIVKDSIQIAANMETTAVAFETMAGSAEKADMVLKGLREFAKESPLTFQQGSKIGGNLLANGIAPQQVVPTVRMLSDAGRGNPEIIDRLALAYTQVRSKGHLMTQELNQFAETGLPLEQALADVLGKQKDEMRGLIEAGRVGFPDLQKALKKLTEEGGAFYGMTEKYSKTFSGQMDALRDSVDMAKGAFGKAIIEEMGLKDAAGDTAKFADTLHSVVNEARPAIRFVGDVAKAGVQLGYLGARMTAVLGNEAVKSLMDRFPVIRETVQMIQGGLRDIESMRFDDAKVQDFGKGLFDVLSKAIGKVWDSKEVQGFYADFKKEIIDPLKQVFADIKSATKDIKDARATGNKYGEALFEGKGFYAAFKTRAALDREQAAMDEQHGKDMLLLPNEGFDPVPRDPDQEAKDWARNQKSQDEMVRIKRQRIAFKLAGGLGFDDPMKDRSNKAGPVPVDIGAADPLANPLNALLGIGGVAMRPYADKIAKNNVIVEQGRDAASPRTWG